MNERLADRPITLYAVQERLDDHTRYGDASGIKVNAKCPDGVERLVDIAQLDEFSLDRWMRHSGGRNPRAERCVLYLLGWRNDPH